MLLNGWREVSYFHFSMVPIALRMAAATARELPPGQAAGQRIAPPYAGEETAAYGEGESLRNTFTGRQAFAGRSYRTRAKKWPSLL